MDREPGKIDWNIEDTTVKISQAVRYAILALCQLDDPVGARPISCRQLAKLDDMPERFLLQVLRNLVNHKVLTSTRGVEGGYRLAKPSSQITLLAIVEAAEGPVVFKKNSSFEALNGASRTALEGALREMVQAKRKTLEKVTLDKLKPRD